MGGTKQLEAFLFNEFKIVGLAPGDRVKLLDLLVKKKGAWGTQVINNLGSFLHYRPEPSDASSEFHDPDGAFGSYQEQIEQGLKLLADGDDLQQEEGSLFTAYTDYVTRKGLISTSSSLVAKVLQYFTGKISTSNDLECTIVYPTYHVVNDESLHEIFVGDEQVPALWKPNLPKIKRAINPEVRHDGTLELWIVREKVYCDEFKIQGLKQTSAGASAVVDGHTMVGLHAGSRTAASRQTHGRSQLGFKAIRLFYDSHGDLQEWRPSDMGAKRPTLRDDEGDQSFRDPFFHLGGLFAESPSDGEPALSLQCLDIENVN